MDSRIRSDERSNAFRCVSGEGLFGVGMGLVAPLTVLPLLLQSLGASDFQLGLAGSIGLAGWVLLQPVGFLLFGRRRRTKRFLIPWSLCFSVPTYVAMAALVYFLGPEQPHLCAALLLLLFGIRVLGGGAAVPFWLEWQATIFRRAIRGRVIGMISAASGIGGALGFVIAGRAQDGLPFPVNYSLLFAGGVLFFLAALAVLFTVREPASFSAPYEPPRMRDLFRRFAHSLRERNFRSYLIGRILMTMGGGALAFYAVYFESPEGGGLSKGLVTTLGVFLTISHGVSSVVLGRWGDRAGHKAGVVVGALAQFGGIAVAFLGRGPIACAACFLLVGVAWAAGWVSHLNMLFETCPHDSRVAHITVSNLVLGPVLFLVPMATGWMMEHVANRTTGIGLTLIPTFLGLAWLALAVREPRDLEVAGGKVTSS